MDYKIVKILTAVVFLSREVYTTSISSVTPFGGIPPPSSITMPSSRNGMPSNNQGPQSYNGTMPSDGPTQTTSDMSPLPTSEQTYPSSNNSPVSSNDEPSPVTSFSKTNNEQVPPSNIPLPLINNQTTNTTSNNGPPTPIIVPPTPIMVPPILPNNQTGNNTPISSSSPNSTVIHKENDVYLDLISTISEFQADLYSILVPTVKENINVAISAFSVQTGLALLYCGAGGQTASAMQYSLIFNNLTTIQIVAEDFYYFLKGIQRKIQYNAAVFEIANAIYIKEGYEIRKSYQQMAKNKFFSQVENIDFNKKSTATKTINEYITEKTSGKITDLVDASTITNDTVMILVNTIYFQAYWNHGFSASETVNRTTFHTSTTTNTTVDLMYQEGMFSYLYMTYFQTKVIKLDYYGSDMSMLILLPDNYNGMSKLESDYETFNYTDIIKQMGDYKVKLYLPKFTIDYETNLKDALTQLGMRIMFNKEKADFQAILKKPTTNGTAGPTIIPQIYVSEVRHKAHIEVNEKGTVAAAATEIMMRRYHSLRIYKNIQYAEFKADHPFMFIIIKGGQDVMFTGRYVGGN